MYNSVLLRLDRWTGHSWPQSTKCFWGPSVSLKSVVTFVISLSGKYAMGDVYVNHGSALNVLTLQVQ